MHNLKANYDKILPFVKLHLVGRVTPEGNIFRRGTKPKMSDCEVIALSLVAEALSIDSENLLFSKLKAEYSADFPQLISRSNYNVRRRALRLQVAYLQAKISVSLESPDQPLIVDSVPLPVCKLARAARAKICRDDPEKAPKIGYCAAHKQYYYGYKLHVLVSAQGVPLDARVTSANVHDVGYLAVLKETVRDYVLIADKGYISQSYKTDLFTFANVELATPSRSNMTPNPSWTTAKRKQRKVIETRFSQLCDQFMLHRNYAKSVVGLLARINAKICAVTILQYYNVFVSKRPIAQIKHALAY